MNEVLKSTTIRRMILNKIAAAVFPAWVIGLILTGRPVTSNSPSETYADLFSAPVLREWVGKRAAKLLGEYKITVRNRKFESTLVIPRDWIRFDKLDLIMDRINSLANRAVQHWVKLIIDLVKSGTSVACYDGEYFFSATHPTGDGSETATTMSNSITVDISATAVATHGTTTAPSVAEAAVMIRSGMEQIRSFTDDQGEPMNEDVENFLILCPLTLEGCLTAAVSGQQLPVTDGAIESLRASGKRFTVVGTPRLAAWTDKFAIFGLDGETKPFILQEVGEPEPSSKAEGSDFEHDNDAHEHGIMAMRGAGFGAWQAACLVQAV